VADDPGTAGPTAIAGSDRPDRPRAGSWLPWWRVAGAVFVAYPIVRIIVEPPAPFVAAAALGATAIFAAMIAILARRSPNDPLRRHPALALLDVALIALATAIVANSPDQGWVALFYYASTAASMLLPERRALGLIAVAGVLAGLSLVDSQDLASAIVQGLSVSVIGITVFAMTALRRTNIALYEARQELADRAVADERDRIARDLHDVLGHSLSLIAIKSELAGRLLPGDPDGARVEIADVERVARESLASVRDTVSGARQPTLANELENARAVLEAAGIASTLDHRAGYLAPAEDAVLAWAVREAVTNVVRHSGARHAAIHTSRPMTTEAAIEVVDDGGDTVAAEAVVPGTDGTGLRGLRYRLESVGGRLEAGPLAAGGYRLSATIPVHAPI
jgi:two-component system sensor histidine kinase DesK